MAMKIKYLFFCQRPEALPKLSWQKNDELSRLTRAALADVDAGRVVANQTVQDWANSLAITPIKRL